MALGLRSLYGVAAPPFTIGPYVWDQALGFGGSISSGVITGSSTTAVSTSTANTRLFNVYLNSTATSGDARAEYARLWISGAAGGGEALRAFTTINGVAGGTAHGAHISLNFVSTSGSGSLSGLGVAMRGTLHIPNDASFTSGTLAAIMAEIYADGSSSDTDGCTEVSFLRVVNGGDATGGADTDDDAFLISAQGFTVGAGNLFAAKTSAAVSHTARIKIGDTTYYLMLSDTQ